MPNEKIVVGIPNYGRGWRLPDSSDIQPGKRSYAGPASSKQFSREAGMASYYEICDMLSSGATRYWHAEQQVPFLVNGDEWWSYDDVESIRKKVRPNKKVKT